MTLDTGERVAVQRYRHRGAAEPWAAFELLPGVPVPEAGDEAIGALARPMGELLAGPTLDAWVRRVGADRLPASLA